MARPRVQPHPVRVTVVRYLDAEGRPVRKGTEGARHVVTQSDSYYAVLYTGGVKRRVPLKTTDLRGAWVALDALQKRLEREGAGIVDPTLAAARRPIAELVEEWVRSVRNSGVAEKRVTDLRSRVLRLVTLAGWRRVTDMTADSLRQALAALATVMDRHGPSSRGRGRGPKTRNHYLSHARQFAEWCVEGDRLLRNPFRSVRPVSTEEDIRHARREPTDDEVRRLFDYLPTAPVRIGTSGPQRLLAYQLAMSTGFRAGELRRLVRASFALDGVPTVTVAASFSRKKKRSATQQLPAWLADELRAWLAKGGGLWTSWTRTGSPGLCLRADLEAAGVERTKPAADGVTPLHLDFHSLRGWYISRLADQPDISPKTLLELARHSDSNLTLRIYAKRSESGIGHAVDSLPRPGAIKPTKGGKE